MFEFQGLGCRGGLEESRFLGILPICCWSPAAKQAMRDQRGCGTAVEHDVIPRLRLARNHPQAQAAGTVDISVHEPRIRPSRHP